MANIQSAIKRIRQNKTRHAINRHNKTILKNSLKKIRQLISDGDFKTAREQIDATCSSIDKSKKFGIIHPNKAARLKSRLSASINKPAAK